LLVCQTVWREIKVSDVRYNQQGQEDYLLVQKWQTETSKISLFEYVVLVLFCNGITRHA
jgi:hypothetical protein